MRARLAVASWAALGVVLASCVSLKRTPEARFFVLRSLAEPAAVLREHGIAVPPGVQVTVVEDTDKVRHLTLPVRPPSGELAEETLAHFAGGAVDAFIWFRGDLTEAELACVSGGSRHTGGVNA